MKEYFKIVALLTLRLMKDFPVIVRLFMLALPAAIVYLLLNIRVEFTGKWMAGLIIAQLFVSFLFFRPGNREAVLLKTLRIPLWKIKGARIMLVAVFFFLINLRIAALGTLVSLLLVSCNLSNTSLSLKTIPTPFVKSSYRWLAAYRKGGFLIILFALFLQVMACIHANLNLGRVSMSLLIFTPGMKAAFMLEPKQYLYCYRNTLHLLRSKISENLINSTLLASFSLPFAVYCLLNGSVSFLLLVAACIYLNLLLEAVVYASHPVAILSALLFFVVCFILIAVVVQIPLWLSFLLLAFVLFMAYVAAYFNLNSCLYGNH